jgi:predicted DCC family thiol-disulfide oxidoreductase YuxK
MQPREGIIVFDGVCLLCNRSVQFVIAHDRRRLYRFAAVQGRVGAELMRCYGLDPAAPASMLLIEEGRVWTESDAVVRIAVGFGGAWRLAGLGRVIPRALRDAAYRFVARHRYRWFGRRDHCMLPSPQTAERFLR